MANDSADNTQTNDSGRDRAPFVRKPFQFTLRTLFLVTLVVALFCSAAATFDGIALLLAIAAIAWAVIGAVYWKMRAALAVVFAHLCGPAYAAIVVWAVSAGRDHVWIGEWNVRDIWEVTIGVGFIASSLASVGMAFAIRRRRPPRDA